MLTPYVMACGVLAGLALDSVEARFGATDSLAALANGQLALALSERGDVTALRWPSTGLFDQLDYVTVPPPAAGTPALPRQGAQPDMGLFVGLRFEQDGQAWVEWPHLHPRWQPALSYLSDTSRVVRVEYTASDDGLVLVQEYWLDPEQPRLLIHLELQAPAGAAVPDGLVLFENLAPCDQQLPGQPVADWLYDAPGSDAPNDFAALYSARADAVVHLRPREREELQQAWGATVAAIGADPAGQDAADALLDQLVREPREGTYLVLGAVDPSLAHQVGRADPEDAARPRDAYLDAADGALGGQPAVLGAADAALLWRWPATAQLDLVVCAGAQAGQALALLEDARLQGFGALSELALRADGALDRAMAMPRSDAVQVRRVARRAIRAAATAQSAASGALVAALAGQPPLAMDCPADSAWVREALDRASLHAQATAHGLFLATAQQRAGGSAPAGRWWTCHASDGTPAAGLPGALDATALAAWSLGRHVQWLRDARQEGPARTHLDQIASALVQAGDALADCRDPASELTCASVEDEDATPRQSLRAAALSAAALEQIASALALRDSGDARVARYRERAGALRQAARAHFVDAAGVLQGGSAERALALHPGRLLEAGALRDAAVDRLLDEVEAALDLAEAAVQDLPLRLWVLTEVTRDDGPRRQRLRPLLERLFALADARTAQYGGLLRRQDSDGDGVADSLRNQVATPYLPAGALAYLAAVAFYGVEAAPASVGPIDTCGCGAQGPAPLAATAVLAVLILYRRSRQRTARGVLR